MIVECHAKERELKKENIQIKYAGMAKTGDVTTHPKFRLNRKTKPSMIAYSTLVRCKGVQD